MKKKKNEKKKVFDAWARMTSIVVGHRLCFFFVRIWMLLMQPSSPSSSLKLCHCFIQRASSEKNTKAQQSEPVV